MPVTSWLLVCCPGMMEASRVPGIRRLPFAAGVERRRGHRGRRSRSYAGAGAYSWSWETQRTAGEPGTGLYLRVHDATSRDSLGQAGEMVSPRLPPHRSTLVRKPQPCGLFSVSPAVLGVSQEQLHDLSPTHSR